METPTLTIEQAMTLVDDGLLAASTCKWYGPIHLWPVYSRGDRPALCAEIYRLRTGRRPTGTSRDRWCPRCLRKAANLYPDAIAPESFE